MPTFPPDQFDEIPQDLLRVGAHRAPRRGGGGWIAFAWAALATGVLVVLGLAGLSLVNPNAGLGGTTTVTTAPAAVATDQGVPAVAPTTVDPTNPSKTLVLSVFDGAAVNGLQNTAADALKAAGWPDASRANASSRTETTTIVYYSSAAYEGIARGIVTTLGVGSVQMSSAFPGAPVNVVVGQDYADSIPAG